MNIRACAVALIGAVLPVLAQAADPVAINFDQANPPFMYGKEGKAAGIYPAVVELAFKRMKQPVTLHAKPWARALQEIDGGLAGVGGIYKNAEREKKYDFSEQLFSEKLVVYYNKSTPITFAKVDDLKGKRVGVLRGWSYGDEFDAARKTGAINAEETASDEQNLQKLELGRLDAVIAVAESGEAILPKLKNVSAAPTPLAQNATYLAFLKSAGQTALLKQFDQTIKDLRASGEFSKAVDAEVRK